MGLSRPSLGLRVGLLQTVCRPYVSLPWASIFLGKDTLEEGEVAERESTLGEEAPLKKTKFTEVAAKQWHTTHTNGFNGMQVESMLREVHASSTIV